MILVLALIASLILIHVSTYFWVRHNKRVAARGKRGAMTRYLSPVFSKDCLGRTLIIEDKVPQSSEIAISVKDGSKFYRAVETRGEADDLAIVSDVAIISRD